MSDWTNDRAGTSPISANARDNVSGATPGKPPARETDPGRPPARGGLPVMNTPGGLPGGALMPVAANLVPVMNTEEVHSAT
ncbi:MAG TPA: hypothetical protein VFQ30_18040, partial [Ktedonobacteraceae bacterium]|nr:hypothetical protein [Ktedonobacteraceae bacterium]